MFVLPFLCPQEIAFPKMVASCCRFLCYFCRISRQNQKAMFDHLSYLLENSSVGLGTGWSPLPFIHFSSFIVNVYRFDGALRNL